MHVFHYCAEMLKGKDIFTTCTDDQLLANNTVSGSVYNDFDNDPLLLLDIDCSENESEQAGPSRTPMETDIVSQEKVDQMFLRADEEDENRWIFDHELFDNTSDTGSRTYLRKVNTLVQTWDDIELLNEDIYR